MRIYISIRSQESVKCYSDISCRDDDNDCCATTIQAAYWYTALEYKAFRKKHLCRKHHPQQNKVYISL